MSIAHWKVLSRGCDRVNVVCIVGPGDTASKQPDVPVTVIVIVVVVVVAVIVVVIIIIVFVRRRRFVKY